MTPIPALTRLWLPVTAMIVIVVASNILVQFPINDWFTWGTFSFPLAFLVTDLTNRRLGPAAARRVIYAGFPVAVLLSALLGGVVTDPAMALRVAAASGFAFLMGQVLDVAIFDRMRRARWWQTPLVSSAFASAVDTIVFFAGTFAGTPVPWQQLALGDFGVKLVMGVLLLVPYRALMAAVAPLDMPARRA